MPQGIAFFTGTSTQLINYLFIFLQKKQIT